MQARYGDKVAGQGRPVSCHVEAPCQLVRSRSADSEGHLADWDLPDFRQFLLQLPRRGLPEDVLRLDGAHTLPGWRLPSLVAATSLESRAG